MTRRKRYTEEQIIAILKEAEAGVFLTSLSSLNDIGLKLFQDHELPVICI
jgi:hypothetical protein